MDRFGSLWIVLGSLWVVVDRCGSLWVVVGRYGWFRVLVTTTNNHETSIGTHDNISNSTQSSNVTPTRKRLRRKIKPTNIQLDHSSVINLSSYSLSTDETSVLALGLAFCPTPRHIDWPEVSADIYDFSRRMRLTEYFFDDKSKTSNSNEDDTPFHNKSTWNPPNDRERALDTFLDAVKLDITTCTPNKTRDNLTITDRP